MPGFHWEPHTLVFAGNVVAARDRVEVFPQPCELAPLVLAGAVGAVVRGVLPERPAARADGTGGPVAEGGAAPAMFLTLTRYS